MGRRLLRIKEVFNDVANYLRPAKKIIIFVGLPILFSPIPLGFQTKEASCAYVVILMSFFWVTEVVPLAVTALIPLVLYPLLGVAKATDVANTYFSDSNFVFFGSMVMAAAVEAGRLHERIALRILNITGSNPRWSVDIATFRYG